MSPLIEMKPLSRNKRRFIFGVTILLFIVAVPISVFYAIGYRFDFTDQIHSIKSVGGMYVRNDAQNTEMFIDDQPVVDIRVFQKAAYIQNLVDGMHRIHVQGDFVQTWVKELPVYAYFVTEVTSFNLPKVPQIRLITKWNDAETGSGIVFDTATSTKFAFASTTNPLLFSTSTATSSFVANTEYTFVKSLFASSSELLAKQTKKNIFSFTASSSPDTLPATTTKSWRNFKLFQKQGEVFISWNGDQNHTPYYYCLNYESALGTTAQYGQHVYDSLLASIASSTKLEDHIGERMCRTQIGIDDLNQKVIWFDFFPGSTDLILMHLTDGLYVVEVDDRAWQNSQLLYPGKDIKVIQDGGRIYIHDGKYYLEVFTEIASQT